MFRPRAALICSPSADDRECLSVALNQLGIEAVCAASVEEGVALADADRILLILLDIEAHAKWEVALQEFQYSAPEVPVIICARLPDTMIWLDALETGAFDVVCRPFSERELRWVLENALKFHSLESLRKGVSSEGRPALALSAHR
jgi:DNA-binding NtrC family response regulator